METQKMRCMRCKGRKTLYKVGAGYSYTNMGGVEVDCPMCLGEGKVKTLESVLEENAKKVSSKSSKAKNKDVGDEKENIGEAEGRSKAKSSSGKAN